MSREEAPAQSVTMLGSAIAHVHVKEGRPSGRSPGTWELCLLNEGTVATTGIFPWNGKSNDILSLLNRRLRSYKQSLCSVVFGTRTEPAIKPHLCSTPTL